MEAAISFTIYKDFSKNLSDDGLTIDYTKALKSLNKYVKDLVESGDLVISYNGKSVKIILPIVEDACGNIFGDEDDCGALWDSVEIWCKIPYVKVIKFCSDNLKVEKCPTCWSPERVFW